MCWGGVCLKLLMCEAANSVWIDSGDLPHRSSYRSARIVVVYILALLGRPFRLTANLCRSFQRRLRILAKTGAMRYDGWAIREIRISLRRDHAGLVSLTSRNELAAFFYPLRDNRQSFLPPAETFLLFVTTESGDLARGFRGISFPFSMSCQHLIFAISKLIRSTP